MTPANGTVVINADGTYTYTPNSDFDGTDSFSYVVTDPGGARNEYTVTVTISDVNDNPVGSTIPDRSANDGAVVNFDVSSYFSDADGDTLTYTQTGLPNGLSLSAAGLITGTIDRNASQGGTNGVYTVTITVSDGNGGTAQQTFALTVSNPAPVAVNDTVTTAEDTAVAINVLANDSDPDGDPLSIVSATAAHGTVTILADGEISYLPAADYNGTDTITYTISDGNGGTTTATVTVTITPVNDDPAGSPIADRTRNDGDTDSLISLPYSLIRKAAPSPIQSMRTSPFRRGSCFPGRQSAARSPRMLQAPRARRTIVFASSQPTRTAERLLSISTTPSSIFHRPPTTMPSQQTRTRLSISTFSPMTAIPMAIPPRSSASTTSFCSRMAPRS
ncbi:hemagglutinin/hemolysin-like protein [Bradyrhizobium lupini HPC(L)]|uniref:Hemagglutinin/hemolysin-like protein n=1 Tax=Bradyrhizobium lupini HPC(L) TaxID=1229491 RepID=A0ABN0HKI4_RHILU|nr:hemagglutinin/hemolysin-like protein [Bradyrhizobium lupini HPC(L)]